MSNLLNSILENVMYKKNVKLIRDIFPKDIVLKNISCDNYNIFTQLNYEGNLPNHGFKIHVSATINNFQEILDIVSQFLNKEKISFKYVSNKKYLNYILSNSCNRSMAGKFITIYPINITVFKKTVLKLSQLLKYFSGCKILTDRSYNNTVVHYRYGLFVKNKKNEIIGKNGEVYIDSRQPIYKLPDFIEEPFPLEVNESKYINKKYYVESVIQHKPTGGVYIGYSHNLNSKVIIKEYIPPVGFSNISNNYKKNEGDFLKINNKNMFFPKFIDEFYDCGHYFLIESNIEGQKLFDYRASSKFSNYSVEKVVRNILNMVKYFHDNNYFIMDISDRNIIVDNNFNTYFIDLDNVLKIFNSELLINDIYRTKGFYNYTINKLEWKLQDLQQIGYLILSLYTRSNMLLTIDFSGEATFKMFLNIARVEKIPKYIVSLVYSLIYSKNNDITYYIDMFNEKKCLDKDFYSCFSTKYNYFDVKITTEKLLKLNNIIFSDVDKLKLSENLYGKKGIEKILMEELYTFDNIIIDKNFKIINENINKLVNEKNFCLENGLSNIYINAIHNKFDEQKIKSIETLLVNELKNIKFLIGDNTGLYDGYLSIIYALSSNLKLSENKDILSLIIKFINKFLETCVFSYDFNMCQSIKVGKHKYSSYVSDGIAGLLKTLIKFSKNSKLDIFDNEIDVIAKDLLSINYTQNASYGWGKLGIIDALLDYYEYIPSDKLLKNILYQFTNIENYIIKYKDNYFIPGISLTNLGLDFNSGSAGYILVYNRINNIKGGLNI